MSDETEPLRRARLVEINAQPGSREALEAQYGQVWDTAQLSQDFEVIGFMAPLVVVRRRSDGVKGSLEFQHAPRLYWGFVADKYRVHITFEGFVQGKPAFVKERMTAAAKNNAFVNFHNVFLDTQPFQLAQVALLVLVIEMVEIQLARMKWAFPATFWVTATIVDCDTIAYSLPLVTPRF